MYALISYIEHFKRLNETKILLGVTGYIYSYQYNYTGIYTCIYIGQCALCSCAVVDIIILVLED